MVLNHREAIISSFSLRESLEKCFFFFCQITTNVADWQCKQLQCASHQV